VDLDFGRAALIGTNTSTCLQAAAETEERELGIDDFWVREASWPRWRARVYMHAGPWCGDGRRKTRSCDTPAGGSVGSRLV